MSGKGSGGRARGAEIESRARAHVGGDEEGDEKARQSDDDGRGGRRRESGHGGDRSHSKVKPPEPEAVFKQLRQSHRRPASIQGDNYC